MAAVRGTNCQGVVDLSLPTIRNIVSAVRVLLYPPSVALGPDYFRRESADIDAFRHPFQCWAAAAMANCRTVCAG